MANKSKANVNPILRAKKKVSNLDRIDLPVDRGNQDSIDNATINTTVNNTPGSLTSSDNLYDTPQVKPTTKLDKIDTKVPSKEEEELGAIDTTIVESSIDELPNIHGEVEAKAVVELPNIYNDVITSNSLGNENVNANGGAANSTPPTSLPNVND